MPGVKRGHQQRWSHGVAQEAVMENRHSWLHNLLTSQRERRQLPQLRAGQGGPGSPAGFDFDQLARDLAGGLSRREALRRLGAGLGSALLASLGLGGLAPAPAR